MPKLWTVKRPTLQTEVQLDRYIAHLKALDFVNDVTVRGPESYGHEEFDAVLGITTPAGEFKLGAEIKSVYPNRALVNLITATAHRFETRNRKRMGYVALLTRTARIQEEKLIEAGVNFMDLAGNLNLKLGQNYQALVVGRREQPRVESESSKLASRAGAQLLFTLAADPSAANWPTRQLAQASGISKSIVARLERRLVHSGILQPVGRDFQLAKPNDIRQQLLAGYSETLYPRILFGRFRSGIRDTKEFLLHASTIFGEAQMRWSLTGGPAADLLQHYFRGEEIPIFVERPNADLQKKLRLLPDRTGPIKLLSAFGAPAFWRTIDNYSVAHPWLIFAELMQSEDSRAHEAAQELYTEFLANHDRTLASAD
jgi:hypothetical protein